MGHIEIETTYERELRKQQVLKRKLVLVAKATTGLFAVGLTALTIHTFKVDKSFEYDQEYYKPLSEQYMEYTDQELPYEIKNVLNSLSDYEEYDDDYEVISKLEGVDHERVVSARMNLIDSADKLIDAAYKIIELKVSTSLGLSPTADISIKSDVDNKEGINYYIEVIDGDTKYTIDRLPFQYIKLLNTINQIESYTGNGSSEKWDSAIDEYKKTCESCYYRTLSISIDEPEFHYKQEHVNTR